MKTGGCPKCGGDIYIERDIYGDYIACLQCSFMRDLRAKPMEIKTAAPTFEQKQTERRLVMDARNREIYELHRTFLHTHHWSYAKIGEKYGLTKGTVKAICIQEQLKEGN